MNEIDQKVVDIFTRMHGRPKDENGVPVSDEVLLSAPVDVLDITSLAMLETIMALEEELGIRFSDIDVDDLGSLGEVKTILPA